MNASNYWLGDSAEGPKLLRKGEIGDWKNYFTSDLNEKFENEVMNKIKGTGLVFDFGVDVQNSCDCAKQFCNNGCATVDIETNKVLQIYLFECHKANLCYQLK